MKSDKTIYLSLEDLKSIIDEFNTMKKEEKLNKTTLTFTNGLSIVVTR